MEKVGFKNVQRKYVVDNLVLEHRLKYIKKKSNHFRMVDRNQSTDILTYHSELVQWQPHRRDPLEFHVEQPVKMYAAVKYSDSFHSDANHTMQKCFSF